MNEKREEGIQAPVPPPPAFIKNVIEESKKKPIPTDIEDKVLAEGAGSDFWKIVKRHIENKIKSLDAMTRQSVRGTINTSEIGFRYLIFDQVSSALNDVINLVELRKTVAAIKAEEEAQKKQNESR